MPVLFTNNAVGTLASSVTLTASSVTLTTGHGALFPAITGSNYFYATLVDAANNYEIVKVTARATDVLTVSRAQEGTTARAFAAASKLELRVTAAGLSNLVQLDGAQTVTGVKTFSSGLAGALTGNVTGNVTGNAYSANVPAGGGSFVTSVNIGSQAVASATFAANVSTANFDVQQSGSKLYFKYNGTNIASLDSSGNLITLGNVTAYGTP